MPEANEAPATAGDGAGQSNPRCGEAVRVDDDMHAILSDLMEMPVFRALVAELHRREARLERLGVDLRDCTIVLTRQRKQVTSKVLLEGGGYTLLTHTPLAGIE